MDAFDAYRGRPGRETLVALLQAHQDTVYNLCYQVLRHPQNAQDAAQQVLMRLLEALPRITDGAHLKQWLHRAAFHASLDLKKAQNHRREREAKVAALTDSTLPDDAADEVHAHVSRLDDDLRALVVEHYFEKKPLGSLAEERGVSTVAVWKKLERAREKLRESLSRAGYASAVPGLDQFLASMQRVSAPQGLPPPTVLSKAAAATISGGIAVKIKTMIAVTVLVLGAGGALSFAVIRQHNERRREIDGKEEARAGVRLAAAAPTTVAPTLAAPEAETPPVAAADQEEPVEVFKTLPEFVEALQKACVLKEDKARWKALRRIGLRRTDAEFRKAELELQFRPGTREFESEFFKDVLKEWAVADFKGFVAFMMRLPEQRPVPKRKKLEDILLLGSRMNRGGALEFAQSLTEEEGRTEILKALPALEPPKPEAVLSMPKGPERTAAMKELLGEWARRDPRAAAQWIGQLPEADARSEARSTFAAAWGGADLRAASTWVDQVATGRERHALLRDVIGGAAQSDPKGAFTLAAKSFEVDDLWCQEVQNAYFGWALKDPAALARFLHELPGNDPSRSWRIPNLAALWSQRDPSAALEWAERLEGEVRTATLGAISAALVKSVISSPKEALSIVDKLPESQRAEALGNIVRAWAEVDPRAAAEFVRARPERALDGLLAEAWARRDFEAALAWARTLPQGPHRDAALEELAIVGAKPREDSRGDPERAANVAREILDPARRDRAMGFAARQLGSRDLEKAIAMTSEILDPARRKIAQGGVLGNGASKDPQACLARLTGMADATQEVYGAFAQEWARNDPRAAVEWASGLSRPDLRGRSLNDAFPLWAFADSDAARTWVERGELSDTVRKQLLKWLPQRR